MVLRGRQSPSSSSSSLSSTVVDVLLCRTCAFVAPVSVRVRDHLLFRIYALMMFLVLVYFVVYVICVQNLYADVVEPVITQNFYSGNTNVLRNTGIVVGAQPYCSNHLYDAGTNASDVLFREMGDGFRFYNATCVPFVYGAHVALTPNSLALATALSVNLPNQTSEGLNTYDSYFTVGVERLNVSWAVTLSARGASFNERPPVEVRTSTGEYYTTVPPGYSLRLSVAELVRLSGVSSLDALNDWAPGYLTPYRTTGLSILAQTSCTNMAPFTFLRGVTCIVQFQAQTGSWAVMQPSMDLAAGYTVQRLGVVMTVVSSGRIGQFSWAALISQLVNFVVLMGIATVATDYVGRWFLPRERRTAYVRARFTDARLRASSVDGDGAKTVALHAALTASDDVY